VSDEPRLTQEQEERLALYRAGALGAEARAAFEREVLESEALAEELYAEIALEGVLAAGATAAVPGPAAAPLPGAVRRAPPTSRGAWLRMLPVAAALLAVSVTGWWLVRPHDRPGPGDILRGGAGRPGLLEPTGAVSEPPQWLRWNSVPGAAQYRVELFDESGHGLAAMVTADTMLGMDALAHRTLIAGEWRVVPIGADGREGAPLGRATFRVGAGGR
jgi:hypothetical protein